MSETQNNSVEGNEYGGNEKKDTEDAKGTQWVQKSESDENYSFDGKTYHYTDKESGLKYKWDLEKNDWITEGTDAAKGDSQTKAEEVNSESESEEDDNTTEEMRQERRFRKRKAQPGWGKQGEYSVDPDTGVQLYKDANDGMTYEWDKAKNAWFPRIDESFMAQYQMSYGFTPDGKAEPTLPSAPSQPDADTLAEEAAKKAKKAEESKKRAQWFEEDEEKTTKVYVSNLPDDIDEEIFLELMSKCGVIDVDVRSNKPKIKIYKDSNGMPKGDALCTYVKVESVTLALTILDGSTVHSKSGKGFVIKVERAKFEMKGAAYDPTKKPKKLGKKELEKAQKRKDKLLAWVPDQMRGMRKKSDKVIVIENVFDPKEFDRDASLILECSGQLREHCSKFGSVTKVVVYDKHLQGVCQVFFKSPEEADMAISMLDGRIYNRACGAMKAYTWDGKTKYKITETEDEEKERLANWENFLKSEDAEK